MYVQFLMNELFLISLTLLIMALSNFIWKRRWLYYYAYKIPGPLALPFIGSAYLFLQNRNDIIATFLKLCANLEPIGKLWLGPQLFIVVTGTKEVEQLLSTCLEKPQYISEWAKPMFGGGLVAAKVDQWKKNRKIINLTFNQNILNSFVGVFVKHSLILVGDCKTFASKSFDIFPIFLKSTFNIISESCMGVETSLLEEGKCYFNWITRAEDLIISRYLNPLYHCDMLWKLSSTYRELKTIEQNLRNFTEKIVEDKRKKTKGTTINYERNFLSHLIKLTDQDGRWENQKLMDETQTMILAGNNSTTLAEGFFILMMAIHPQIQERVYEEIESVFGNSSVKDFGLNHLNKLNYLECAIKETLRLFPIGPVIMRSVLQNVDAGSYVIPAGSTLLVPIGYIHRNPNLWPDPLKFSPERFLFDENKSENGYLYMPFSISPRNCIGWKFAMMSMKTILSIFLKHYKVTSCEYNSVEDIKLEVNAVLIAKNGYKVTLEAR